MENFVESSALRSVYLCCQVRDRTMGCGGASPLAEYPLLPRGTSGERPRIMKCRRTGFRAGIFGVRGAAGMVLLKVAAQGAFSSITKR